MGLDGDVVGTRLRVQDTSIPEEGTATCHQGDVRQFTSYLVVLLVLIGLVGPMATRRQHTCSFCHKPGHKITTCLEAKRLAAEHKAEEQRIVEEMAKHLKQLRLLQKKLQHLQKFPMQQELQLEPPSQADEAAAEEDSSSSSSEWDRPDSIAQGTCEHGAHE